EQPCNEKQNHGSCSGHGDSCLFLTQPYAPLETRMSDTNLFHIDSKGFLQRHFRTLAGSEARSGVLGDLQDCDSNPSANCTSSYSASAARSIPRQGRTQCCPEAGMDADDRSSELR